MTQAVLIPWRFGSGDDAPRTRNLVAVNDHLKASTFLPLIGPADYHSPGSARNKLVAVYSKSDDVLVFNDADTICPPSQMFHAIELAEEAPGLVFAYSLYCRLTEHVTEEVLKVDHLIVNDDWMRLPLDGLPILNSGSMGCVAIRRACFEEVGGFDESYVGWGYEDLDFATRCNALWPNRRVTGPVFHLWHGDRRADDSPQDADVDQVTLNHQRWLASA